MHQTSIYRQQCVLDVFASDLHRRSGNPSWDWRKGEEEEKDFSNDVEEDDAEEDCVERYENRWMARC